MRHTARKYAKSWMVAHSAGFAGERLIRSGELHVGLRDFDDDSRRGRFCRPLSSPLSGKRVQPA
jgi:hypothetical protein